MKTLDPASFEAFHEARIKQKKRSRWDNPIKRKLRAKKEALSTGAIPEPTTAGPKRPTVLMPDEYLPPNKILFIQNLPTDTTKDQLTTLFLPSVAYTFAINYIPTNTLLDSKISTRFV